MISIIEADYSEFYFSQKGLWHLKVRLQIMMNSCDELLEEILVVKRLQFLFYSKYEMNLMIEFSSFFYHFSFLYSCVTPSDCAKDLPSTYNNK